MTRGFFAIGVYHPTKEINVGTLWRTASIFGASFIYTVGHRYSLQSSDTLKTPRHVPLFHFEHIDDLHRHLPEGCPLVGVELDPLCHPLRAFTHPERAAYILGSERTGLPKHVMTLCHYHVRLPGEFSLNVAVAGSIVLYDRITKRPS